jgi:hypothetical protein
MPIPDFVDNYYLPPGEHICTMEETFERFGNINDTRKKVWECFLNFLRRFTHLGINPTIILINGSFVTGRQQPDDVDAVFLIPPDVLNTALRNTNTHDKNAIFLLVNPNHDPQIRDILRDAMGTHGFVTFDQPALDSWSQFFRCGDANGLKEPNPERDPSWVKKPAEKGILKIIF